MIRLCCVLAASSRNWCERRHVQAAGLAQHRGFVTWVCTEPEPVLGRVPWLCFLLLQLMSSPGCLLCGQRVAPSSSSSNPVLPSLLRQQGLNALKTSAHPSLPCSWPRQHSCAWNPKAMSGVLFPQCHSGFQTPWWCPSSVQPSPLGSEPLCLSSAAPPLIPSLLTNSCLSRL